MITRVLVAGGTGRLGTLVVRGLAVRGVDVRVLTRDPKRAAHLAGERIEVVTGDVRDPVSTMAAVAGVDVVVSAVHGFAGPGGVSPETVDRDGNTLLIKAAQTAGAEVVLMSIVGAAPDSPFELFRMKYAAETVLAASAVPLRSCEARLFSSCGSSSSPVQLGEGTVRWFSAADRTRSTSSRSATSPHWSSASQWIRQPAARRWRSAARRTSPWTSLRAWWSRTAEAQAVPCICRAPLCAPWPPQSDGCAPNWEDKREPHSRWTDTT